MISILALSVLGAWSYAGFLAERSPAPPPEPTAAPAPIHLEPEEPREPAEAPRQEQPPPPPMAPTTKPAAAPPPLPPAPTLYRLSDASGQVWEHSNPAYLSGFIEDRNRWLESASSSYTAPRASRFGRRRLE
jgi:hypothetical protein